MMLKWIFSLVLPLSLATHLQKEDNTILWNSGHRLVWGDFRGRPDGGRDDAALTSSGIEFSYKYDEREGFTWHIACLFDKNKSWVRVKNDYILAHEQGHFDVTEIFARKLNRQLKEYRFNRDRVQKEVPALYQSIMKEQQEMENRYDEETDNSRIKNKQAAWLEKIKRDLDASERYADYK